MARSWAIDSRNISMEKKYSKKVRLNDILGSETIRDQLNLNGRLLAILGEAPSMRATLITKTGHQDFAEEILFETVVPPLHVKHENTFVF